MQTGSMRPVICPGDLVLVERLEKSRLRSGDILLLPSGNPYAWNYIHRLIAVSRKDGRLRLLTKGDANLRLDPPVFSCDVLGRVVLVSRPGRGYIRLDGW